MEVASEEFVAKHRGQISLEFLLILAISLSFLLVISSMFLRLKSDVEKFIEDSYFRNFLIEFEKELYEVCLLGDGNERVLNFYLIKEVEFSSSGKSIKIGNFKINSNCEVENVEKVIKKGIVKIMNENGKIYLYFE